MIQFNAFSVIDLLAVIISAHVLLVFCYRSLRVTKRQIDFVFTAVMFLVFLESILCWWPTISCFRASPRWTFRMRRRARR